MADGVIETVWVSSSDPGRLTKYEVASAIGRRARQIGQGAPALVDVADLDDPLDMATRELYQRKNPLVVRRFMPSHTPEAPSYVDVRVCELAL